LIVVFVLSVPPWVIVIFVVLLFSMAWVPSHRLVDCCFCYSVLLWSIVVFFFSCHCFTPGGIETGGKVVGIIGIVHTGMLICSHNPG